MHPSSETSKTYHAWISGKCSETSLKVLRSPLVIDGYQIHPAEVDIILATDDYTQLSICIHEGRNRQIRKMCECAGVKLTKLKRVSEGPLKAGAVETPDGSGIARFAAVMKPQKLRNFIRMPQIHRNMQV